MCTNICAIYFHLFITLKSLFLISSEIRLFCCCCFLGFVFFSSPQVFQLVRTVHLHCGKSIRIIGGYIALLEWDSEAHGEGRKILVDLLARLPLGLCRILQWVSLHYCFLIRWQFPQELGRCWRWWAEELKRTAAFRLFLNCTIRGYWVSDLSQVSAAMVDRNWCLWWYWKRFWLVRMSNELKCF